jgi:hypothetical protein
LSDITGATGLLILEAEIAKALTGTWQEAQLFILSGKIAECDNQIEQQYQAMESRHHKDAPLPDLPPAKPESTSKNEPTFNVRAQVARIIGVELVAVMGLSAVTVQTIISEIGTDMRRLPTVKPFCAWLGLAPRNDISGGKVLRSGTMKVRSRANQAFRQAAQSVARSDSAVGVYYRAMRARLGPGQAIVATAHKIARIVYHPGIRNPIVYRRSPNSVHLAKWALIPFWAHDPKIAYSTINARAEDITDKPVFRNPFVPSAALFRLMVLLNGNV